MAYEKQTWAKGDVVTSAKLNHMEDGIAGGGVLVVNAITEGQTTTLDKTWQEIVDSDFPIVVGVFGNMKWWAVPALADNPIDSKYIVDIGNDQIFECEAADGYPSETTE